MGKIKVKYDKKKKMYTVYYGKIKSEMSYRLQTVMALNNQSAMFLSIDTSLGNAEVSYEKSLCLTNESERQQIEAILKTYHIPYQLKRKKREVALTIMGVATKNTQIIEDYYLLAYFQKHQFNEEIVNGLMMYHDYILALVPEHLDPEEEFHRFQSDEIKRANEIASLTAYFIDSQYFHHYYCHSDQMTINDIFLHSD